MKHVMHCLVLAVFGLAFCGLSAGTAAAQGER